MGYFTADMRDVGTGLRATSLLHLPALAETGGLGEAFNAIDAEGVKYEIFPASSRVSLGDLMLLSNARALGNAEGELIEKLEAPISALVHYEREARDTLLETRGEEIRRSIDDAIGYLKNTGAIGGEEAIHLVSRLRLAAITGMIESASLPQITSLFFLSQPSLIAHGRSGGRKGGKGSTVNERRALLLRQQLESIR
jgi:protein arginine kinase